MQYEPPCCLIVPFLFVFSYYIRVRIRGFAPDKSRVYTITLSEHVFMMRARFIVNVKNGALWTYYTGYLRFDHVFRRLPFWLPANIPGAAVYFGMQAFAVRMGMDPLLRSLAVKRYV